MARLQPYMKTTELMVRKGADPKKAAAMVANFHRSAVIEVRHHNRTISGSDNQEDEITAVDGRRGAPLESVRLDGGTIDTLFPFPIADLLEYIDYLLITRSPVLSGRYSRSHRLFADGIETDPDHPDLNASSYTFTSSLPYARKIEGSQTREPQGSAPKEGVYRGAVALANQRYGNVARIAFTFQGIVGGGMQDYSAVAAGKANKAARARHNEQRYPAIRIRLR